MKFYNQLKGVPAEMTKKITGGRLNGMTDIKPQWRYLRITEVFGDCGVGWYYTIKRLWTEKGTDEQVLAFAEIDFFYKNGDEWSKPIAGIGGSMMVTKEKSGMHNSDECYKMAVTDALSVALKMIGVGADIYMGYPPETKYQNKPTETPPDTKTDKTPDTSKPMKSLADVNIEKAMKVASVSKERLLEIVKSNFAKPYNNLTGLEKESLVKLIEKEIK